MYASSYFIFTLYGLLSEINFGDDADHDDRNKCNKIR